MYKVIDLTSTLTAKYSFRLFRDFNRIISIPNENSIFFRILFRFWVFFVGNKPHGGHRWFESPDFRWWTKQSECHRKKNYWHHSIGARKKCEHLDIPRTISKWPDYSNSTARIRLVLWRSKRILRASRHLPYRSKYAKIRSHRFEYQMQRWKWSILCKWYRFNECVQHGLYFQSERRKCFQVSEF